MFRKEFKCYIDGTYNEFRRCQSDDKLKENLCPIKYLSVLLKFCQRENHRYIEI